MFDYAALAALAEVIRRASFDAAAQALGVTPSAVSQRIKALEDRVGAVLVHRGPPVSGTDAGLRLVAHLDRVRLMESALGRDLRPDAPAPIIRLAINSDSLAIWAMPPLAQAPGLVDVVIDDQDHADGWLRSGLVSAAITGRGAAVTGCDRVALGRLRYIATATPEFAARHFPDGPTAQALGRAPAVTYNARDGLQTRWAQAVAGRPVALPTHLIPATQPFAEAVRLGMGWGMNPLPIVAEDLRAGRLVPVLDDRPLDVALHWQVERQMSGPLAGLTRAIRAAARDALLPPAPA